MEYIKNQIEFTCKQIGIGFYLSDNFQASIDLGSIDSYQDGLAVLNPVFTPQYNIMAGDKTLRTTYQFYLSFVKMGDRGNDRGQEIFSDLSWARLSIRDFISRWYSDREIIESLNIPRISILETLPIVYESVSDPVGFRISFSFEETSKMKDCLNVSFDKC